MGLLLAERSSNQVFNVRMVAQDGNELGRAVVKAIFYHPQKSTHKVITHLGIVFQEGSKFLRSDGIDLAGFGTDRAS